MLLQTWTGRSGREWDLVSRPDVTLTQAGNGVLGLGLPEIEHYSRARVGHGSRWTGWRVSARRVAWPVSTHAEGDPTRWLDIEREFWDDLHPAFPGVWKVTADDGGVRTLRCRVAGDSEHGFVYDPTLYGRTQYVLELDGDPFWTAEPITRQWGTAGYQGPWLIPAGAPDMGVMRFAAGQTFGSASVTNPGDVDAWPTWTITGSASSWSVGVGSQVITSSAPLLAGEQRIVRTDGGGVYVTTAGGSNRFSELGAARAAAIPAGQSVSLSVNLVGSGSVAVSFQPRHLRAY